MDISNDYFLISNDEKMDICLQKNDSEITRQFIKHFSIINKFGITSTNKYYEKSNLTLLCLKNKLLVSKYFFYVPEDLEKIQTLGIKYINYYPNMYHEYNISPNNKLIIIFGTTIINNLVYNIISNIIVSFEKYLPKIIDHCLFIYVIE
uniref:Uncharacterized protein n=1 Tax=Moumouvirus sp. 'Monve' TaxID=1128131 RepID=H2EE14_9VIRU|nr:hypothetical protein mv_L432 [Moumouvirus Monve]